MKKNLIFLTSMNFISIICGNKKPNSLETKLELTRKEKRRQIVSKNRNAQLPDQQNPRPNSAPELRNRTVTRITALQILKNITSQAATSSDSSTASKFNTNPYHQEWNQGLDKALRKYPYIESDSENDSDSE